MTEVRNLESDDDIAEFFIDHIDNPCQSITAGGHIISNLDDLLKTAKIVLTTMTDPVAKKKLGDKIKQYRPNTP